MEGNRIFFNMRIFNVGMSCTQGGLSAFVQSLRMECIDLLVEMEARLDFDDEMPNLDINALITRIETMCQRLQQALATAGRGRLLQSGLQVQFQFTYVSLHVIVRIFKPFLFLPVLDNIQFLDLKPWLSFTLRRVWEFQIGSSHIKQLI